MIIEISGARGAAGAVKRRALVDMPEIGALAQLQPEIPVLVYREALIEAAIRAIEQVPGEQHRVDGDVVVAHQQQPVEGLREGLDCGPAGGVGLAGAAVGGAYFPLVFEKHQQLFDVVRGEPVVFVEKKQIVAAGAVQPEVCGGGPAQG